VLYVVSNICYLPWAWADPLLQLLWVQKLYCESALKEYFMDSRQLQAGVGGWYL